MAVCAASPLAAQRIPRDEPAPVCTITKDDLQKVGGQGVAEIVKALPVSPTSEPKKEAACTPPGKSAPSSSTPDKSAPASSSAEGGLGAKLDAAEKKLDEDIKACRPIDLVDYQTLSREADRNFRSALKAANAGAPVDTEQLKADRHRSYQLVDRATAAIAAQKACPPNNQAKEEPPKTAPQPQPEDLRPKKAGQSADNTHSSIPAQPLNPFDQRILDIHNAERAAVHVPALQWNTQLETDATAYAQQLALIRQIVHAPREGRGIERENLLQARIGWSPDRMMQSWTMEKRDFVAGYYPNVALDGNWLNVSHYTQMIWPTTTDLGCGEAEGGGFNWLVCRYSPGGNKDGKPVGMPLDTAGNTTTATTPATTAYQWIDAKTGKSVNTVPVGIIDGFDQAQAVDDGRAYNPRTGRNFVRLPDGSWIDAKTGKSVRTVPVGIIDGFDQAQAVDDGRAYNPRTGRNFVRVKASPQPAHLPERG